MYFSVGTCPYQEICSEARLIASAACWLLDQRNDDGTWGGSDSLDRFISTNHATMALFLIGFSPESKYLARAVDYLRTINPDEVVSFFWRSATLLNIKGHEDLVKDDMEYIWRYKKRIGAHKDYPIPFFLLKLFRFIEPRPQFSFNEQDLLGWILEEWDPLTCWYDRVSITSMAVALIYDLSFPNRDEVLQRSLQFLLEKFTETGDNIGYFNPNLVENCFLVFNLCETDYLKNESIELNTLVKKTVPYIEGSSKKLGENVFWESSPPFGGNVDTNIYPTAVAIRALLAYHMTVNPLLIRQIWSLVIDHMSFPRQTQHANDGLKPFWGVINVHENSDTCFVLMPFKPDKLTEIYERYLKRPIEKATSLRCIRADDIYKSSQIMQDVWDQLNGAKFVIAELTNKNPNVFYELGMAHVLGKNVILISQSMDFVPFDLRGVRTIIYDDSPSGYEFLSETIVRYITNASALIVPGVT